MVIADTGFWLALANRRDRFHGTAVDALNGLHVPLITTWPVLTETCHLLLTRLGNDAQARFMESVRQGACALFAIDESHAGRIAALMRQYQELPMDLADASLVLLAEHLGHGRILSTDQRNFNTYRWKRHHPFENLLPAG